MKVTTLGIASLALFTSITVSAQTTVNTDSGSNSNSLSNSSAIGAGSSMNNLKMNSSTTSLSGSNSNAVALSGQGGTATAMGGRASATGGRSSSMSTGGYSGGNMLTAQVTINQAPTTAADTASSGASAKATPTGAANDPITNKSIVEYQGSYSQKITPSMAAPSLTTTLSDTCMGSTSFGLSVTGFGATGGTTMVDQACVRRLDAREFRAMGLNDVALALLCQSDANKKAVEATGHFCPGTQPGATTSKAAPANAAQDVANMSDDERYKDPIVRRRLGLDKPKDENMHKMSLSDYLWKKVGE